MLSEMRSFLEQASRSGALAIAEPQLAAEHFFCLLKGEMHMRRLIGCCDSIEAAECEAHIDSVVRLFLRAYLPRGKSA